MKGTGNIFGKIDGNKINFQKVMPAGSILHTNGYHEETGKVHSTLFYSGKLITEEEFEGKWKFRFKIAFLFGVIPFPYSPGSGTWSMKRQ
jgi:hypothetical protein